MVTMHDIAQRVHVSTATVSRVLSGKGAGLISPQTQERVRAAAREMGYRPVRVARGFGSGRTGVVALWLRNPDAPYYASMLREWHEAARGAKYEVILSGYRDHGGEPDPASADADMDAWPVDGVLAVDCPRRVASYLARWGPQAAPVVCAGNEVHPSCDAVTFDSVVGVRQAARHLLDMGCRRVLHLSAWCSISSVRSDRERTFVDSVLQGGAECRVHVAPDETRASAREHLRIAWRELGPFDGIFCINDDVALGAMRGLADLDVRVGQDVALVGCDDIDEARFACPALTSIRQPVEQLCAQAWQALARRMRERFEQPAAWLGHPAAPERRVLEPSLTIRESSTVRREPAHTTRRP